MKKETGIWFASLELVDGSNEHVGHCAFGQAYALGAAVNALKREDVRTTALCFRPDGRKHHRVLRVLDDVDRDAVFDQPDEA